MSAGLTSQQSQKAQKQKEKKKVRFTTIQELRKALPTGDLGTKAPPENNSNGMRHEFYIETKPIVDRILIRSKTGDILGEMRQAVKEEDRMPTESIIWNGTAPLAENPVYLTLLGGEGTTEYYFNDLFSKPIDVEILKLLASENVETYRNTVVINVPK